MNYIGVPYLTELITTNIHPPLGAIAWTLEKDLQNCTRCIRQSLLPASDATKLISTEYDKAFGDRPDYRLWRVWRIKLDPNFSEAQGRRFGTVATEISRAWSSNWHVDAHKAFRRDPLVDTNYSLVIAWGGLSMLPTLIQNVISLKKPGWHSSLLEVIDLAKRSLQNIGVLSASPANCGAVAIIFLNKAEHFRYYLTRRDLVEEQAVKYVRDFEKFIKHIDRNWICGEKMHFASLQNEDMQMGRLRPYGPRNTQDLTTRSIEMVRNIIDKSVKTINPDTEFLLHKAKLFARTAWLQARWQRFDELEYQKEKGYVGSIKSTDRLKKLYDKEANLLQIAALAAVDAGDCLECARLNHIFFRCIPDELASDPDFRSGVKQRNVVFRIIREAGLEVDARFPKPEWYESPGIKPAGIENRHVPEDVDLRLAGFQLLIEHDQRTNPIWAPILTAFPRGEVEAPRAHFLRIVRHLVDSNAEANEDTLRAGFELCIHYSFIRSAAKLIERINPRKNDVMDFAHAIKRCMQNIPIGMLVTKVQEWQEVLRSAWTRLDPSEMVTVAERFVLHEILMGRFLSIKENMNGKATRMLTDKYHGMVSIDDLRAFYDDNPTIHWKGPGAIEAPSLAKFARRFTDCELGCPVHISACFLSSEYSFAAVSGDGDVHCDQIIFRNLMTKARRLRESYKTWFRLPDAGDYQQIPWYEEFVRFAQAILQLAQKCDHNVRWIVLSLDPELVSLPWQHLFLHLGRKLLNREVIITLTPNLGWAPLAYRETTDFTYPTLKLRLSEDDEIMRELKTNIEKHLKAIHEYPVDAAIVLGHGKWDEDDSFPKVTVGQEIININDWIEIARSRLVVLHSCHSGRTQPQFLGDYGALPGLILGLGTRLLCAPVAEVSPPAAEIFNEHIFRLDGQKEIGVRYLAAIKKEPSISMYNLYGMAAEPVYLA